MNSKSLLSHIKSDFIFKEIISYIDGNKVLEIFKYNNKFKSILNISLYNYQIKYLKHFFDYTNPLNYNIDHLYNIFKSKGYFNKKNGKKIFIKIIHELYPEEKNEESQKYNFIFIENLPEFKSNLKNLSSIELKNPTGWDLKQIDIDSRIKELKIIEGEFKIPFGLIKKLETLILEKTEIEIYDINKKANFELENLKNLNLNDVKIIKNSNMKKFLVPNLTDLNISLDVCYKDEDEDEEDEDEDLEDFILYFNIFDFDIQNDNINDLINENYETDINYYYDKYKNLKNLILYFFDFSEPNVYLSKYLKIKKIKNNILQCEYEYQNTDDNNINEKQKFLYDKNNEQFFRRKIDFENGNIEDYGEYEEIFIKLYKIDNEDDEDDDEDADEDEKKYSSFNANLYPFFKKIKDENYTLQVMKVQIENRYTNDIFLTKKDIKIFCQNLTKFKFLRVFDIDFSEQNFENVFDSKELNILIKNLSSLQLLEIIKIKIRNKALKIPNDIHKKFLNMDIKKEEDCLLLSWKYI